MSLLFAVNSAISSGAINRTNWASIRHVSYETLTLTHLGRRNTIQNQITERTREEKSKEKKKRKIKNRKTEKYFFEKKLYIILEKKQ